MKSFFAAIAVGATVAATGANAADVMPITVPTTVVVPVAAPPAPAFDWSRFYAGAVGGVWLELDPVQFYSGRAAGIVGKGFTIGERLVVAVELQAGVYYFPAPVFEVFGVARTGVLLGERVLAYGLAGIGWEPGAWSVVAGGGVEVAMGNHLSVRGEAMGYWEFGGGLVPSYASLTGGLVWHFGR
ncbi:MAG: hypothetical protein KIT43_11745 [Bauldia sp.]|nr:hypothetical protein [Bauldia sp.]